MRWCKDPRIEANLRRLGIKFEVETGIPLADIDREEGMHRQVRLINKLVDEVVYRYATDMLKPEAAFPMPILQKEKRRYFPWSGNHRLGGALLADVTHIDAYVIQIYDPVMIDYLPRVVNTWETAIPVSREETIINARHMMERHGWTAAQAAEHFSLKEEWINKNKRVEATKAKILSLGVRANEFSASVLDDLYKISDNSNVLRKAAGILHQFSVKGKEALEIINDTRRADTEAAKIVALEKWERALTDRSKPRKKTTTNKLAIKEVHRERLLRLITGLSRFVETHKDVHQAQIADPAYHQVVARHWKIIRAGMDTMLEGS